MSNERKSWEKVKTYWTKFNKICIENNIPMSERIAAKQIGITQGAFNQFLNQKINLSERFLVRFAILVGVPPSNLIPALNKINIGVGISDE